MDFSQALRLPTVSTWGDEPLGLLWQILEVIFSPFYIEMVVPFG